jgi:hypothetical protein
MKKLFEGAINHNQINKFNLEQLNFINDILDGKMTEEEKMKKVKQLFPNIIKGTGNPIKESK